MRKPATIAAEPSTAKCSCKNIRHAIPAAEPAGYYEGGIWVFLQADETAPPLHVIFSIHPRRKADVAYWTD